MSDYTKSTNFAAKDALASGNAAKVVKGTEIDTEFNNIATAIATKTDDSSAAITGGTVDGAAIGGTTPAAGSFTTLAASGISSFSAGSASAPAITRTGDTNTGIFFPAADTLAFSTNGTEDARFDSSGNLGLGVTPSAWGSGWKVLQIGVGANFVGRTGVVNQAQMIANAYFNGTNYIYQNTGEATQYFQTGGYHAWGVAASGSAGATASFTQAMTLDSSGNLSIGTNGAPTNARFRCYGNASADFNFGSQTNSGNNAFVVFNQSTVGVYLVSGNTSWTATSDERVKDIIEPIENASEKVSGLRAVIGKYKTDEEDVRRSFLIAQDVQSVFPEAVSVSPDENGTLGLQYTELIPLLVAAIKEQQAIITSLNERITELEAK